MKYFIILLMSLASCVMVEPKSLETFIINGGNSRIAAFYAYIEIFSQSNFKGPMYFGGGTLSGNRHIVTVAQNVAGFKSWRVGLRSNHISNMQWYYSNEAFIHEGYNNETLANNLAVIRLRYDVPRNGSVEFLLIPPNGNHAPREGDKLITYGFGFGVTNKQPDALQSANFTVTSDADCILSYPHMNNNGQISRYFCARNDATQSNICAGDQGGPIWDGIDFRMRGMSSFIRVDDCGSPEAKPAAFLRIAPYDQWILRITNAII